MEIKGEYQIGASREQVWQALNDPEMLKKCIPGCESIEKTGDNEFAATVMAAIGPVRARFNTSLSLENLKPPDSYTLVGESKAGAAGFGRGRADVALLENDDGTLLTYSADFKVGGKLARSAPAWSSAPPRRPPMTFSASFPRNWTRARSASTSRKPAMGNRP